MSKPRIYGRWSGQPQGCPEDPLRCIAKVWPSLGYISAQCSRKRGHGEGALYCRQHAKRHPATPAPAEQQEAADG